MDWRGPRNRVVVNRWRGGGYWGGCGGWGCGYDGYGVGAGIVGFGLGAALAAPYYYDGYYGRRCYVVQGGVRYLVDCDSLY